MADENGTGWSRRHMLAATALGGAGLAGTAARAATRGFGNPDAPAEGRINATGPNAAGDPGPEHGAIANAFPSFTDPPPTDVNGMPLFWASFSNAHRRIQSGGWARELTVEDFAISKEIAGVNMRLSAGGIRELHWHQQAEWSYVTDGTIRITVLDADGRAQVADVGAGGLWYFPPGLPHSLQGLGPDGGEFVLAFDNGSASEFNTLLLTDWVAHTPPEVLAKNFGVPADTFAKIPLDDLWIFQGEVPGPLAADQDAVRDAGGSGASPHAFTFDLGGATPRSSTRGGTVRIADSATNFPISRTIAVAQVTLAPGAMRELHWHPNADEWQYWIKGRGRMTVFDTGPKAQTADFSAGDVGYIKKSFGHYIENTGPDEAVFLEIFKADRYMNVALSDWLTHTPPAMVAAHLNIDPTAIARFPRGRPNIVPV